MRLRAWLVVLLVVALLPARAAGEPCAPDPSGAPVAIVRGLSDDPAANVTYGAPLAMGETYDLTVTALAHPATGATLHRPDGSQAGNPRDAYVDGAHYASWNVTFPAATFDVEGVWSVHANASRIAFLVGPPGAPVQGPCPDDAGGAPDLRLALLAIERPAVELGGPHVVHARLSNVGDLAATGVLREAWLEAHGALGPTTRHLGTVPVGTVAPGDAVDLAVPWDPRGVVGDVRVWIHVGDGWSGADVVADDHVLLSGAGGVILH